MSIGTPKYSQVTPQSGERRKSTELTESMDVLCNTIAAREKLISKDKQICGGEKILLEPDHIEELITAISTLSKMELRARYSAEANTHRNMLNRRRKVGAVVHAEFHSFAKFLQHVGPMPVHGATLDRIDNKDPEYAPGKVRWADKRTQNGNKGDTLLFQHSQTGDAYTTSRLAKLQKLTQNTIRTRYHRGWSDDEIIEGKRARKAFVPIASPFHKQNVTNAKIKTVGLQPTADKIIYRRNADFCQYFRETHGEEYFVETPKEITKIIPEFYPPELIRKHWKKFMSFKLPKWWKEHKPHIRFEDLKPFQQRLIKQIDPSMRIRK